MNRIKNLSVGILAVAACAALFSFIGTAPPALADIGTQDMAVTNHVEATTTITTAGVNGVGSVVEVSNQDNVGLLTVFAGTAADGGQVTLSVARSIDNSVWETTPYIPITITANGTNTVAAYNNLTTSQIGAAGYIKIVSLSNLCTNSITNLVIKVVKKRIR